MAFKKYDLVRIVNKNSSLYEKLAEVMVVHPNGHYDLDVIGGGTVISIPGRELKKLDTDKHFNEVNEVKELKFTEKEMYMISMAVEIMFNSLTRCDIECNEYQKLIKKIKGE